MQTAGTSVLLDISNLAATPAAVLGVDVQWCVLTC
jgi:hypothetical protein